MDRGGFEPPKDYVRWIYSPVRLTTPPPVLKSTLYKENFLAELSLCNYNSSHLHPLSLGERVGGEGVFVFVAAKHKLCFILAELSLYSYISGAGDRIRTYDLRFTKLPKPILLY